MAMMPIRWDAEDLDIREILERLQRHHDSVEREFLGQKDLVGRLQKQLEKEADELKRLLSSAALEQVRVMGVICLVLHILGLRPVGGLEIG
jgi:hypothetical protein